MVDATKATVMHAATKAMVMHTAPKATVMHAAVSQFVPKGLVVSSLAALPFPHGFRCRQSIPVS